MQYYVFVFFRQTTKGLGLPTIYLPAGNVDSAAVRQQCLMRSLVMFTVGCVALVGIRRPVMEKGQTGREERRFGESALHASG